MATDKELRRTGLPPFRWRKHLDFPVTGQKEKFDEWCNNLPANYDEARNLIISRGSREQRVSVESWLLQHVMANENLYSRPAVGHKHHIAGFRSDGSPSTYPYSVKYMRVEELRDLYMQREGDQQTPFAKEVTFPDFFFLSEVGSESPNSFFARIILDLLITRQEAELPTVVTTATLLGSIIDKHDRSVYIEVADFLTDNFKTKVALS